MYHMIYIVIYNGSLEKMFRSDGFLCLPINPLACFGRKLILHGSDWP